MSNDSQVGSIVDTSSVHEPVLLHEVVTGLISPQARSYLDGTLGGAGHALAIAKAMSASKDIKSTIDIIGLDQDPEAIKRDRELLATATSGKVILENENFRNLDKVLDKNGIDKVDMILMDLGLSSDELETSGRGFTFQKDEPLLMTLGDPTKYPFVARDIVNNWKEEDIANVIFAYGEDRYARRIAKGIVAYREKKKIETSMELAEVVKSSVPFAAKSFGKRGFGGKKKIHPATKTFQGLRIAVNDELNALKEGLKKGFERLAPGGKMAVISFHSLEDRIVKEYFKNFNKKSSDERSGAHILTKKPITPSDQEIAENPRSRSAKLRIIQKI